MDVRVLGPVRIDDGNGSIPIESARERAVLATLALNPARTVSATRLIEGVWGSEPPDTANKTLQWHISRLRKTIGPDALVTTTAGYQLDIPTEDIDASEFERLLEEGSSLLEDGDASAAAEALRSAMALWRGDPFTDLGDGEFRVAQERRFHELHLLVRERLAAAELALGHHERAIPDLEAFVAEHPYRERPWSLLMLALYRSGRQVDALRTYQRLRIRLAENLGIDPSDSVRRLEERILRQDPQLDLEPPPPAHNLPAYASSFIGRSTEVDALVGAVGRHRLVSIVGAGGIGKSRLACESARAMVETFHEGVWWIDLAPLRDEDDLATRVALTLGAPLGSTSADDALRRFLHNREMLIVLDNCEHLRVAAARLCGTLVAAGTGVRVLTTTRAALDVPGETRVTLAPLSTATATNGVSDAAALFTDRARGRGVDVPAAELPSVRDLVTHTGGIPLAIELAAARSTVLTPEEMCEHLSHAVDLPGGRRDGAGDRHHSLSRVLDLSYELLDEKHRLAFDLLGVFRGAFDIDAAAAVVADSPEDAAVTLDRLLDASMIVAVDSSGRRRFRLLEPMRRYASSHLSSADAALASERHATHFRAIVSEIESSRRPDIDAWRRYLWAEDDNLSAAVEWSLTHGTPTETLAFADAVAESWYRSGRMTECVATLQRMLDGADDAPAESRAMARSRMVWPAFLTGHADLAFEQNALAGDEAAEAGNEYVAAWSAWNQAHMLTLGSADYEHAKDFYEAAIDAVERHPDRFGSLGGLIYAGRAQSRALANVTFDDDLASLALAEERLTAINDLSGLAHVWMARWLVELRDGMLDDALRSARRNVELGRKASDPVYEQIGLAGIGTTQLLLGDVGAAYDTQFQAVRICQSTNNVMQLGVPLIGLAAIAMTLGEWEAGARLWGAGVHYGAPWPIFFQYLASVIDECRQALGDRFDELVEDGDGLGPDDAVALAATLTPGIQEPSPRAATT